MNDDIVIAANDMVDTLRAIRANAKAIVTDQTEMHPAHRELVQALVDAAESCLKRNGFNAVQTSADDIPF